jgi:type IV secretory pathway VirB2 component (pilin)
VTRLLSARAGRIVALVALACVLLPTLALANAAGGGGMPYSAALATFNTSLVGEVAGIICIVCIVGGVVAFVAAGPMDALLLTIGRVIIGAAIISGATAFLALLGGTGAAI